MKVQPALATETGLTPGGFDEDSTDNGRSARVTTRRFDTATGALLFTGVTMQPAGMLMDWRSWSLIPAADATAPAQTIVISLVRANGQVQDTLTYTVAEASPAILTAAATQTPQPVGHH
jgi:hypothetical protein